MGVGEEEGFGLIAADAASMTVIGNAPYSV